MNDRKNVWVWVGVAVVVVAVVWAGIVWLWHPAEQGAPVHAPTGQVVQGFPQDLILGASASADSVTNSYSINYSTSTNQYTAEWMSSSTPDDLYSQYQSYVSNNGWTVTNQADTATLKGIYATNDTAALNVVITSDGGTGSKVTVSYTKGVQ